MDLLPTSAGESSSGPEPARPTTPTGALTVTWLGHSSVVIDIDDVRLITDPLLRRHAGPLRRRGRAPHVADWTDPNAVLLSHLHHDHAEVASLRMLPPVPILTSVANAGWLNRKGLAGRGLGAHEWVDVTDRVRVRLTPAEHHSRPMPHRPNDANGHLVRGTRHTVWAVGDTSVYEHMADVPTWLGAPLDLILVPIGGWAPRLSAGHMGPEQAAEAVRRSGARYAVPVHYGTLHPPAMQRAGGGTRPRRPVGSGDTGLAWMDRPLADFVEVLPQIAPACQLVALSPGQSWVMPEGSQAGVPTCQ
ncbi:MAG: MBL fold metallo-hydrolase [Nostocoides sp.]